jgi:hypothetical protein
MTSRANDFVNVRMQSATTTKYRYVPTAVLREHKWSELSRAFGFDECSTWYDLPKSIEQIEPQGLGPGRRLVQGYAFQGPKGSQPIAVITVSHEREKFREEDSDDGGWLNLGFR